MRCQHTIRRRIEVSGPSVCSDVPTELAMIPTAEGIGIVFWRTDLHTIVHVRPENVKNYDHMKWTCLEENCVRIECTEHLLAAIRGMEIDNLLISLSAPWVPLLDGSALPFVEMIEQAGKERQSAPRLLEELAFGPEIVTEAMTDFKTGTLKGRTSMLLALPERDLTVLYSLEYEDTALPDQVVGFKVTPEEFAREIAPARTFMTPWELERWGPGGNKMLSNYFCKMVPQVSETETFEERLPNEAARHKVLDMIGDLAVFGPFVGRFVGIRSGHSLNNKMVRRLHRCRM